MSSEKSGTKAMRQWTFYGRQQREKMRQDELETKKNQEEGTMATQQALLTQLRDRQQLQMQKQQQK